jgi:SAM-dependent methyltransferase
MQLRYAARAAAQIDAALAYVAARLATSSFCAFATPLGDRSTKDKASSGSVSPPSPPPRLHLARRYGYRGASWPIFPFSNEARVQVIHLQETPTDETFDEEGYLLANPDVAAVVATRKLKSGWVHFKKFGRAEGRRQYVPASRRQLAAQAIPAARADKMRRLAPLLSRPPLEQDAEGRAVYLTSELVRTYDLSGQDGVSENGYDDETERLIQSAGEGLVLDVGAGNRPVYYPNVVNYEVVNYATTDVLGVAEELPFRDNSFEGVISIAVLEHVKDPFLCARELARVLKPGGWLKCCVPFLQPLHGYPHHYFNMTHEGLRTLFEPYVAIERQEVTPPTHPVWAIAWQLREWANALPPKARKDFLRQRVGDLITHPAALLQKSWAQELPMAKQFELAAATILIGRKRA